MVAFVDGLGIVCPAERARDMDPLDDVDFVPAGHFFSFPNRSEVWEQECLRRERFYGALPL